MKFRDHFSGVATDYAAFRPQYPAALVDWLATISQRHDVAWDCACGSGQASRTLAAHFDQIVATLRHEKEWRQFLIATHNANIPVLCDAELIIVLQATESRSWVDEDGIGSIDTRSIKQSLVRSMEGGKEAFNKRKEKYGPILQDRKT